MASKLKQRQIDRIMYRVKNGNQQTMKQAMTTANERVMRTSAVMSRRFQRMLIGEREFAARLTTSERPIP